MKKTIKQLESCEPGKSIVHLYQTGSGARVQYALRTGDGALFMTDAPDIDTARRGPAEVGGTYIAHLDGYDIHRVRTESLQDAFNERTSQNAGLWVFEKEAL